VRRGPRTPTAIATWAAVAFITVFGKTRGERPRGPRSRNPSAKVTDEWKSPQ
jgi:hypothetical protein